MAHIRVDFSPWRVSGLDPRDPFEHELGYRSDHNHEYAQLKRDVRLG
jgi:hypothetical protein